MKKCTQGDPEAVCFVWGGGVPQGTVLVPYRLGSDLFSLAAQVCVSRSPEGSLCVQVITSLLFEILF